MAEWVPLPLPADNVETLPNGSSAQAIVNLLLDEMPGAEPRPVFLKHSPGVVVSHSATATMRAASHWNGNVLSVRGTDIYSTEMYVSDTDIGNLAGSATVVSVRTGSGVAFVSSGGSALATDATVTAITPPAGTFSSVAQQDGYTIYGRSGTDEFYISALDDPTTIGALDFSTADSAPGYIVGMISDHRELVILKDSSIEFWVNTGAAAFPFERQQPGVAERGCVSPATVAKYENSVFWIGDDFRVYRMTGYQPTRISPAWMDTNLISMLATARASIIVHDGRSYYAIHAYSGGIGYWYDIALGTWVKRSSTTISRLVDVVAFDGVNYAAGQKSTLAFVGPIGKTYYKDDGETTAARTLVLPMLSAGARRASMAGVMLEMQKQTAAGNVSLSHSDDGGVTYSAARTQDGTLARITWARLGRFARRILKFAFAADCPITITGVFVKLDPLE